MPRLKRLMAVKNIGVIAALNVNWLIQTTAAIVMLYLRLMAVSRLGEIVRQNARLLMQTIAGTGLRPSVAVLLMQAVLISLIARLKFKAGVANPVM